MNGDSAQKSPNASATVLAWEPGHHYSPIPNITEIKAARKRVFAPAPPQLPGIELNAAGQKAFFDRLCRHYDPTFFPDATIPERRFFCDNDNFRHGEAVILSSVLRELRPKRVIEIGSGYSSCATLDTRDALGGVSAFQFSMVEPYPNLVRSLIWPEDLATVEIVEQPVQQVPTAFFETLEPGDVLFIDSTHVCKTDSDLNHHLFRILPALSRGTYIHFHDIYYPFEYPEDWVMQGRAWNELYALRAFLQYNQAFEIVFFNSYFFEFHREAYASGMPAAMRGPGSSLWLRKVAK